MEALHSPLNPEAQLIGANDGVEFLADNLRAELRNCGLTISTLAAILIVRAGHPYELIGILSKCWKFIQMHMDSEHHVARPYEFIGILNKMLDTRINSYGGFYNFVM